MAKIKLKTTLKTKENTLNFEVLGLKNNNHYSYLENDFTVILDIHEKSAKMVRKKDDYELEFYFDKNNDSKCNIYLNDNVTSIPVITHQLEITDKSILIVYEIDKDYFQYLIQFEEDI